MQTAAEKTTTTNDDQGNETTTTETNANMTVETETIIFEFGWQAGRMMPQFSKSVTLTIYQLYAPPKALQAGTVLRRPSFPAGAEATHGDSSSATSLSNMWQKKVRPR